MKITIAPFARGGMRSVIEAYERDGFLLRENVRVIASYEEGSFLARQLFLIKALSAYIYLLFTKKVELVHIHVAMRGSFWRKAIFATIARALGVPVLLHLHGSEMKKFYASQRPFLQKIIRKQLENADCVIVLSESWSSFVREIAPNANIIVVPNYVIVPPERTVQELDTQTVLFLGLVGPRKGTHDLIAAFADVHHRYPASRLIIGGNGNLEDAKQQIKDLNLVDAVELAGWVDQEGKAKLLAQSSVYVLPSYNEGLPMSVLEAMGAGLATVTTRVGGIPELITDGVDGFLINPGDVTLLADRICTLVSDSKRRQMISQAGRNRVLNSYSSEVVLPILSDIYRRYEQEI